MIASVKDFLTKKMKKNGIVKHKYSPAIILFDKYRKQRLELLVHTILEATSMN